MQRRSNTVPLLLCAVTVLSAIVLGGCTSPPPALTKAELDSGKMSEKHPKVEPMPENGCRACHREQPPIRQP